MIYMRLRNKFSKLRHSRLSNKVDPRDRNGLSAKYVTVSEVFAPLHTSTSRYSCRDSVPLPASRAASRLGNPPGSCSRDGSHGSRPYVTGCRRVQLYTHQTQHTLISTRVVRLSQHCNAVDYKSEKCTYYESF